MFSFRYIFRLLGAFFVRFRAMILLGIFIGVFVFFLINLVVPALSSRQIEKIGVTGRFTSTSLPENISGLITQGLTKTGVDGLPEPSLAASWETPDKGKTWIFKLKQGISWQDGKTVKSADINYQFSDLQISHPDDLTVVFKLQNAYSAFPVVVSAPIFKKGLLGTGSWKVRDVNIAGGYVTQLSLEDKEKNIKIYKFYPNEDRTKLAFKLGEINKIEGLSDPKPLDKWPGINVEKNPNHGQYAVIFFNTSDKALGEKNLRQALSYAINKNDFNLERAISPISLDSWAYNPQVKPYDYDKEKATKMVSELPKELTENLNITITTSPSLLETAEKIKNAWGSVGVKSNVSVTNSVPQNFQALLVILDTPTDPDQYSLWHSTQTATNISHYSNPRIDKLLEDGRTELDSEVRKKIYLDFQRFLLEDAPAAFLYYPGSYSITR